MIFRYNSHMEQERPSFLSRLLKLLFWIWVLDGIFGNNNHSED